MNYAKQKSKVFPVVDYDCRIEWWWDRNSKNWIVQLLTSEGFQIGEAKFAANSRTLDPQVNAMVCEAVPMIEEYTA